MNDPLIRNAFHRSFLRKDYFVPNTLIVDELGIRHGKCRADIAVINEEINGFEIKSEKDSLARLKNQIEVYNDVFDHSSIVLEERHLIEAMDLVPDWWGIILVREDRNNQIKFETIRESKQNILINDYAVAQLLWRDEAQEILLGLGANGRQIRECRANLYQYIVEELDSWTIRETVRNFLRKRKAWRDPVPTFQYDGSSLLFSM